MDTIKIDTILLINIKRRLHGHYLPIISSSLSLLTCKEAKFSYNKNPTLVKLSRITVQMALTTSAELNTTLECKQQVPTTPDITQFLR